MNFKWVGKVIANPAKDYFTCPTISGTNMEFGGIYDNNPGKVGTAVQNWLASKGKTNLNEKSAENIQYIILTKEVDWQNYNWLNELKSLKLIQETETLKLFQITNE